MGLGGGWQGAVIHERFVCIPNLPRSHHVYSFQRAAEVVNIGVLI